MAEHTGRQMGAVPNLRRKGELMNIPGAKISLYNAQLLTSSGSPSLDSIIGGGLAVGTICLIEEDKYQTYAMLLLKYFLSEGITNKHAVLLASGDKAPKEILKELPSVKSIDHDSSSKSKPENNLKIAWRYKNMSLVDANVDHGYDVSVPVSDEMLNACHIATWNPAEHVSVSKMCSAFPGVPYSSLLEKIQQEIISNGFKTSNACNNILRIGICSLGSPLWYSDDAEEHKLKILKFLYVLKSILRTSFAVAVITFPSPLLEDLVLRNRLLQMADVVFGIESFVGSEKKTNELFKDFDGLFHVKKLPVLNTSNYQIPPSNLVFKVKRKGFLVERLHLPPDLEDESEESSAFSCCSKSGQFDF